MRRCADYECADVQIFDVRMFIFGSADAQFFGSAHLHI